MASPTLPALLHTCSRTMLRLLLRARRVLAAAALLCAATLATAQTFDTAGVRFEPTVDVAGSVLRLNGAGIRYKIVRVYSAGLYLAGKASTPEAVYAAGGPRRLHVVTLREIDAKELGKLFTDGMQKNATRDEFVKAIPGTIRMGEIFATKRKLASGETFSIDYVPGTGTVILVNGKPAGEPIREPEFFTSLMKIWLGSSPADAQLKDALLGNPRVARSAGEP